jgi:AcrR family transcriptional regulator
MRRSEPPPEGRRPGSAGPEAEPGEGGAFPRRGYHHGQLRAALLHAARSLLGGRGTAGFTLADAAKLAGVSPAAPYRHFRDRDALLGEGPREGFALCAGRLSAARLRAADPAEGLTAMGRAYLAFAREEPGLYAAMFAQDAPLDEAGRAEAARAFAELLAGIAAVLARNTPPGGPPVDPRPLALQVWALSHGVASLWHADRSAAPPGADPESLLLDGVRAILQGSLAGAQRRPRPTGVWNQPPPGRG